MVELLSILFAGASVVTAWCALYLTIQSNKTARAQNEAAREHNRLSVKPRLTTTTMSNRDNYLDGSVRILKFGMDLQNVGLGPAVIKTFEVMLDGALVPAERTEDIHGLLSKVFPGISLGPSSSFHTLRTEHALKVGDETNIVAFEVFNPPSDFDVEIKRFSLRVTYESLYGDRLTYDTRLHLDA